MRENKVIILVIFSCFEDMSYLWVGGTWQLVSSTSKGKVINQLLLCIHQYCSFQSVVPYVMSSLSLVTEVMCIPASPGFWMI